MLINHTLHYLMIRHKQNLAYKFCTLKIQGVQKNSYPQDLPISFQILFQLLHEVDGFYLPPITQEDLLGRGFSHQQATALYN